MFKNDIGQEIELGDKVAVVTVCTKRVKLRSGVFKGLTKSGKCRVEIEDTKYEYRYEDTGDIVEWGTYDRSRVTKAHKIPYFRTTTLQLNRIVKI